MLAATDVSAMFQSAQQTRDDVNISSVLEMEEHPHELAAAGSWRHGYGCKTLEMEAWGRVPLQERVTACLSISTFLSAACRGSHQDYPKSSNVPVDEPKRSVRDATSQKKEAEKLEFEAWPGFRSFQIRRMNFRSAVSSSGKGDGLFQGMLGQAAADP